MKTINTAKKMAHEVKRQLKNGLSIEDALNLEADSYIIDLEPIVHLDAIAVRLSAEPVYVVMQIDGKWCIRKLEPRFVKENYANSESTYSYRATPTEWFSVDESNNAIYSNGDCPLQDLEEGWERYYY